MVTAMCPGGGVGVGHKDTATLLSDSNFRLFNHWFLFTDFFLCTLTTISLRLYFVNAMTTSPLSMMESDIIIQVPESILFMECWVLRDTTSEGLCDVRVWKRRGGRGGEGEREKSGYSYHYGVCGYTVCTTPLPQKVWHDKSGRLETN